MLAGAFPNSAVHAVAVGLRSRHSAQRFPANVRIRPASIPFEKAGAGGEPVSAACAAMVRYAAEFGMTPSARSRIEASPPAEAKDDPARRYF